MNKKVITMLLVLALATTAFTGCASNSGKDDSGSKNPVSQNGDSKDGEVTLKIHTLVNEQKDETAVFEALNKLTKEKINTKVDYKFHGGAYGDKISVIISSGEEYDICFTSNWINAYNVNVAKGAFVDLTDMVSKTPKLKSALPDYIWNAAKVNGKLYAVPNQQIVARSVPIMAPKEYISGTGVDVSKIKDVKSAGEYFQKAKEKYNSKFAGMLTQDIAELSGYEMILDGYSGGAIKKTDKGAKVVNIFETAEYKQTLLDIEELAKKGFVDAECVTNPEYSEGQRKAKKLSALFTGSYKPGGDIEESTRAGYDCILQPLSEPYVSTSGVIATMQGISTASKNPERALQYLELINTDADVMNTLTFGIEGKHYTKVGDNVIKPIVDGGYSTGMSWALGNVFNSFVIEGQPTDVWEQTKLINDSALTSPILGFSFNPDPVKLQLVSINKVAKEFEAIGGGALPVEKTLKDMNAKLKTAGIDDVIKEMQAQVDKFLTTNK